MKHLGAAIWMSVWIALLCWGTWWTLREGWWLMGHDWVWTGLLICLAGLLVAVVCVRGLGLVLMLLAGRTTPRLAQRDFRNSLANLLMFAKTGLWGE